MTGPDQGYNQPTDYPSAPALQKNDFVQPSTRDHLFHSISDTNILLSILLSQRMRNFKELSGSRATFEAGGPGYFPRFVLPASPQLCPGNDGWKFSEKRSTAYA
jgi:hypothetical protein